MKEFRVIVAGGRDFCDYSLLRAKCDYILQNIIKDYKIVILCGEANGADSLGKRYATQNGFKVESYPADWEKYGKYAGYIRNTEMAKCADALIAFWDKKSKGTKHMIEVAKSLHLKYRIIYY